MKHFLIILLAICLVLFVLIPLAYMSMGRIDNPWEIAPTTNYNPSYSTATSADSRGPSPETDVLTRVFGGTYAKLNGDGQADTAAEFCANPATSLKPHVRDATLGRESGRGDQRDGAAAESIVSSDAHGLTMRLRGPVTDWQYTSANGSSGGMEDELASFTYDNLIVNVLARESASQCVKPAEKNFKDFHMSTAATEYFSSPIYINQGRPIGLESATLRTFGKGTIDDNLYYWYLLDETYAGFENRPVVTLWYSTYQSGREFWIAFRTYKAEEGGLNQKAEAILEDVSFE